MLVALSLNALAFSASMMQAKPAIVASTTRMPSVATMGLVDSVKNSVVPDNAEQTYRNVVGYQALGWGVAAAAAPAFVHSNIIGATATASSTLLMRGLGWSNLALAGRLTSGSDSDAAAAGVVWFSLWYWAMKNAVQAGAYGGARIGMVVVWNGLMALAAARRNGGVWNTLTSLDTTTLNSLLPRDYELSVRNFVGIQALGWGVGGFFFAPKILSLLGIAGSPLINAMLMGNAITNTVLAGKILGGTDDEAAANGVTFFGAWGVLGALAVRSGVLTGQYAMLVAIWNLLSAAYCASKIL